MIVSEIFYSIQGEGPLAGVPGVFIRLAGCPLRCRWCDTQYAWEKSAGTFYNIEQIIEQVQKWRCRHIVITGGEPLVNPDMSPRAGLRELAGKLKTMDKHITIETAGLAFLPDIPCDLMSISPKLSNSVPVKPELAEAHQAARLDTEALAELVSKYPHVLKFVVESEKDLEEIRQVTEQITNVKQENVMLMPRAKTRQELLSTSPVTAELCKKYGFRFCPRLQIMIWDNLKGR